jgi:hypothetical protein
MNPERRRVLRELGIALAALAAGGCCGQAALGGEGGENLGGDATPAPPPPTGWDAVRASWRDLPSLQQAAEDYEKGEKVLAEMTGRHESALDELVKSGDLRKPVAADMQVAFSEAAFHVWRSYAPISCYEPTPWPVYDQDAKHSLASQAEALAKMAGASEIDAATVELARQAIERDIAFLTLPSGDQMAMQQTQSQTWTAFTDLELVVDEETKEAAHILTEVLLGQR